MGNSIYIANYFVRREEALNNLCNHYSKPELPVSWAHQGKTAVKRPGAIQGLLIGTEGERHSGIVQYPSETTPGMLNVILIGTAKKPTHLRNFKLEQLQRKAVRVIHLLETTEYKKILHLVSLAEKKRPRRSTNSFYKYR